MKNMIHIFVLIVTNGQKENVATLIVFFVRIDPKNLYE